MQLTRNFIAESVSPKFGQEYKMNSLFSFPYGCLTHRDVCVCFYFINCDGIVSTGSEPLMNQTRGKAVKKIMNLFETNGINSYETFDDRKS